MSERPFEVVHIDEIPSIRGVEGSEWIRIRRHLDVGAFGVNAYRADQGKRVIEEHDELGSSAGRHEELYVVLSGRARFTVGSEDVDAPTGTLLRVPPETRRGAIAEEDGTTVLVVGGVPGKAYTVATWELGAEALPFWESKEYDKAIAVLRPLAEANPKAWSVLYNLACAESLAGEHDAALDHLRTAVENDERMREHAKTDTDLDPIRGLPDFPA